MSALCPDLALALTGSELAVLNNSSEPFLPVRDQDHDRLPFCVLQLDSHSVRIGEADIGNNGGGTQCVSFGSEALNESLQYGDAAWLLALSRDGRSSAGRQPPLLLEVSELATLLLVQDDGFCLETLQWSQPKSLSAVTCSPVGEPFLRH
ncbi:MAG TPA: hypothetical protein VF115_03250 [Acidimicrobiia bacterium]